MPPAPSSPADSVHVSDHAIAVGGAARQRDGPALDWESRTRIQESLERGVAMPALDGVRKPLAGSGVGARHERPERGRVRRHVEGRREGGGRPPAHPQRPALAVGCASRSGSHGRYGTRPAQQVPPAPTGSALMAALQLRDVVRGSRRRPVWRHLHPRRKDEPCHARHREQEREGGVAEWQQREEEAR
jgi:hypothetical protein